MLQPVRQYFFDQTVSPNLLSQGLFKYYLVQLFYNPILVVDMLGGGGVANIKIKSGINNLVMTIGV